MRRRLPSMVQGRAIIGVIALYALVLQAVLGGVAAAAAPVHAGGEICAQHDAGGAPADSGSTGRHHACCTAAQAAQLIEPEPSAFDTVAWASVRVMTVGWRCAGTVRARAPPDQSVSPRGPPAL